MRYYPIVFLPERMRTACDRSGANGNGASSRGTRRTDNARGQLETRRFLCWTEDEAAQSERRASLLAFPSQSCVGAANRLQAFMEKDLMGGSPSFSSGLDETHYQNYIDYFKDQKDMGGASYILLNKKIDIDYTNTLINRAKNPAPEIK